MNLLWMEGYLALSAALTTDYPIICIVHFSGVDILQASQVPGS